MKRIVLVFIFVVLTVWSFASKVDGEDVSREKESSIKKRDGQCGDNIRWSIKDGKLTISGEGKMYNYSTDTAVPWYSEGSSILDVSIQNGVTSIGERAFCKLKNLGEVRIPSSVTTIGAHAFGICEGLSTVEFSAGLKIIEPFAFSYCTNLRKIILPSSLESIGTEAFSGCDHLETVFISDTMKSIGNCAFCYCSRLLALEVSKDNTYFNSIDGVLFDRSATRLVQYPTALPNKSYSVPDGVTSIKNNAFFRAKHLVDVVFSDTVTSIGDRSFYDCDGLSHVTFSKSVDTIDELAFGFCSNLSAIEVSEDNLRFASIDGVLFDKSLSKLILYPAGIANSTFAIPDSVSSIETYAFVVANSLMNVIIPDSVTSVEKDAFYSCSFLSSVYYLGSQAIDTACFSYCSDLSGVCVSPDYSSVEFGGKPLDLSSENCKTFRGMFDHCYKGAIVDGEFVQQKRANATEWEEQIATDECTTYVCDNKTGPLTKVCENAPDCYEAKQGICNEKTGKCEYERKSTWNELISQENQCYEVQCDGNEWVLRKRDNASQWEKRTNRCAEFHCGNETGLISWSKCNSSDGKRLICMEGECMDIVDETKKKEGDTIVEIEMVGDVHVSDIDATVLVEALAQLCNISTDKLTIGYETDGSGSVVRMIVYVNEQSVADAIVSSLNEIKKEQCSYGVLCKTKKAYVNNGNEFISGVCGTKASIITMLLGFLVMVLNRIQ